MDKCYEDIITLYETRPDEYTRRVRWLKHLYGIATNDPERANKLFDRIFVLRDEDLDDIFLDFEKLDQLDESGLALAALNNSNISTPDTIRVTDKDKLVCPPDDRRSVVDDMYRAFFADAPVHLADDSYVRSVYHHRMQRTIILLFLYGRQGNDGFRDIDEIRRQFKLTCDIENVKILFQAKLEKCMVESPYISGVTDITPITNLMVPYDKIKLMTANELKWLSTRFLLLLYSLLGVSDMYTGYDGDSVSIRTYIESHLSEEYPGYVYKNLGNLVDCKVTYTLVPTSDILDHSLVSVIHLVYSLYEHIYSMLCSDTPLGSSEFTLHCSEDLRNDIISPFFELNEGGNIIL